MLGDLVTVNIYLKNHGFIWWVFPIHALFTSQFTYHAKPFQTLCLVNSERYYTVQAFLKPCIQDCKRFCTHLYNNLFNTLYVQNTVKPLLSGHLRDLPKCPLNRGFLVKVAQCLLTINIQHLLFTVIKFGLGGLTHLEKFTWQTTPVERVTQSGRPGYPIWTVGLPHLSRLPYLPGIPHLFVNRPLIYDTLESFHGLNLLFMYMYGLHVGVPL